MRNGIPLADALEEQQTLTATGYNLIRVGELPGRAAVHAAVLARLCEDSGRTRMETVPGPAGTGGHPADPGGAIGVIMIGIILAITSANDIAA